MKTFKKISIVVVFLQVNHFLENFLTFYGHNLNICFQHGGST